MSNRGLTRRSPRGYHQGMNSDSSTPTPKVTRGDEIRQAHRIRQQVETHLAAIADDPDQRYYDADDPFAGLDDDAGW